MPGYKWTIHKSASALMREATGAKSKGANRISTLFVRRNERESGIEYTVRSAGFGLRAPWLHKHSDGTLARALRGLQDYYEREAQKYKIHADDLRAGRIAEGGAHEL